MALTPDKEAELESLLSPTPVKKAMSPAQDRFAKMSVAIKGDRNMTAKKMSEIIAAMKQESLSSPSFEPPATSSPVPISGDFTAAKAAELERLLGPKVPSTPFKDLASKAKEFFFTKPAEGAKQIREAGMSAVGTPSEEEIVAEATRTGKAPMGKIAGRVLSETIAESIPMTPTEGIITYLGGKALQAGAPILARGASNLAKGAVADVLQAGLPGAGAKIAMAGLEAVGGSRSAQAAKGLARQLPKLESEIKTLAKGIKESREPMRDLLVPSGKIEFPSAQAPKTVSEAQGRAQLPDVGPAIKGKNNIQSSAESSALNIKTAINNSKKIALKSIAVPKEVKLQRTNIGELRVLQNQANEEISLSKARQEKSFFGKFFNLYNKVDQAGGTSGWKNLERLGPVGQKLKTWADSALAFGEIRAGGAKVVMRDAISRLSAIEKSNLVDVLDQGVQPMTNQVRIAAESLRAIDRQIAKEATGMLKLKRDASVIPWVGRKNHFPHVMDIDAMEAFLKTKGTSRYNEIIKAVQAKEKGSFVKAERTLQDMLNRHKASNFGPLERSRQFDSPFWIRDLDKSLSTYYDGAFKRLEIAKTFGPQNEKGSELLSMVHDEKLRKLGISIIDTVVGKETESTTEAALKYYISTPIKIASESLMGLSQLSNSLQGVYGSAIRGGLKNSLKGLADTWNPVNFASRKAARDFAVRSGSLIEDIAMESSARTTSKEFLRKSGFNFLEEMNRIVASNTAKHYAGDLMGMMRAGVKSDLVERELVKFGLNRSDILKRGFFNDFEIRKIANAFTNISQGRSRAIDLPLFANSAAGKVFYHLKNFGFNWSRFVKEEVVKEAKQGNYAPALNLIGTGAVLGEPISVAREMLTGQKRDDGFLSRRLDAIGWIGGVGILREVAKAASTGRADVAIPASISAGVEATKAATDIAKGAAGREGAAPPLVTATKFAGRRLAPLTLKFVPTPLAIPYLWGSRAIGERAERVVPALGEAIQKRLYKSK